MMRVQVETVGAGLHPKEVVIAVNTRDGREQLSVDSSSINEGSVSIGFPVGQTADHYLVELPQETFRGYWRVWVPKGSVFADSQREKVRA